MKTTLTAIALCAALAAGTTSANAWGGCNTCRAAAPTCSTCETRVVPVEYERVCTTCNPCGSRFNILNPFTYFG